jgi:apolipoprotein N-acyltransferase
MLQRAPKPTAKLAGDPARFWRAPTLWLALAGGLALWAAFPPLNLWPLAWLAPLPWLSLILLPELPGKRPYLAIWLAGLVYWLLMLQGIRLAHWALYAGWFALAWYLAFYLPVFIGLARVAVHRLRIPLVVAAPVVWVGLELIRGHLITGFSMGLLSHTQVAWPLLLQIADLGGAYAVSFVMMTAAAAIAGAVPLSLDGKTRLPTSFTPAVWATVVLAAALGYGAWRLYQTPPGASRTPVLVALIQGSRDTKLEFDRDYRLATLEQYQQLTDEARRENDRLDLVVWPESMFVIPELQIAEPLAAPEGLPADAYRRRLEAAAEEFAAVLAQEATRVNKLADGSSQPTPVLLLVGTTTWISGPGERQQNYNSALLADPAGEIVGRYYKQHAVMFGEYIPLGETFPWIYGLTPMPGGLSTGSGPEAFQVGGLTMSPSICFESVVPHLIRGHVTQLARQGTPADVLVNVTNDGWFWGSSILDLHFRCSVFRAIENRKPVIVAANTGLSTWIDGGGRIRALGPRRATAVLIADVQPDGRTSPYHTLGDWPATLCGLCCVALALVGGWKRSSPLPVA